MKFKSMAVVVCSLTTTMGVLAQTHHKESFLLNGLEVSILKTELNEIENGCESVKNSLRLSDGNGVVWNENICTIELDDLSIVRSGYLTVVQWYASPVGWSKYYVFDFCQRRIFETVELDEIVNLNWDRFLEYRETDYKDYIVKSKYF